MNNRLNKVENEVRFRIWKRFQRMIEHMSLDELEALSSHGQWPDRPEPAPGMSRLDAMDRLSLITLWKKDEQNLIGRNGKEKEYFAIHGHWPEQGCSSNCIKHPVHSEREK